jgi:hypothetical protein
MDNLDCEVLKKVTSSLQEPTTQIFMVETGVRSVLSKISVIVFHYILYFNPEGYSLHFHYNENLISEICGIVSQYFDGHGSLY